MKIPKKLKDEIWEYCRLNDITDIDAFTLKSTQQGFNIEKYGTTPFKVGGKEPKVIEKEVVKVVTATTEVEIIKEIPIEIEVIKEVEKIVEVTVSDNELIDNLNEEKNLLSEKIKQLEESLKKEKSKVEELYDSDEGTIKKLNQKIKNLEIEVELEKNRNYERPKKEKPKEKANQKGGLNNIIKWVSKKDIYNDE
jgi:hypothetical protein